MQRSLGWTAISRRSMRRSACRQSLLRALLLQAFYTVRSERQLMR
jgi:hypothetical protein